MQRIETQRDQCCNRLLKRLNSYLRPFSWLNSTGMRRKDIDSLKWDLYRKTVLAFLAKTLSQMLIWASGQSTWQIVERELDKDSSEATFYASQEEDVGLIIVLVKVLIILRLIFVPIYIKWPAIMRMAMVFDATDVMIHAFLPLSMTKNLQGLLNQVVIDFWINYCGDLWL